MTRAAQTTLASEEGAAVAGSRVAAALLVIALGIFFVFSVGFSQTAFLHDAAHDTRHTLAFPCH